MASRYKFFNTVYDPDSQHTIKGLPTVQLNTLFASLDSVSYKIPLSRVYRPDLIAWDFYGDASLFWVLVYANNFANSPFDFSANKVIQVPLFDRVLSVI
jgi:hypothetical protein